MINELAHIIHPDPPGRRIMAILTFKCDESIKDKRSMMIAGWIADDKQWKRLESRWQKAIAFENNTLAPEFRIRRYHAAEMNAGNGPFKGWETWRKHRFTNKLLKIVSNGRMTAVGHGMNLRVFDEIFPPHTRYPQDYGMAYIMCMGALLHAIAEAAESYPADFRIALIHDHGNWDYYALKGYNQWIDDESWAERKRFVSITPLTWRDDVGLQAADLIAYESMRGLDSELWGGKDIQLRYALKQILGNDVPIYGAYSDREGIEKIAEMFEEKYGYKSGISKVRSSDAPVDERATLGDKGGTGSGESRENNKAEG